MVEAVVADYLVTCSQLMEACADLWLIGRLFGLYLENRM